MKGNDDDDDNLSQVEDANRLPSHEVEECLHDGNLNIVPKRIEFPVSPTGGLVSNPGDYGEEEEKVDE